MLVEGKLWREGPAIHIPKRMIDQSAELAGGQAGVGGAPMWLPHERADEVRAAAEGAVSREDRRAVALLAKEDGYPDLRFDRDHGLRITPRDLR